VLPRESILGLLEIVEVYETHDVPRLFLAENNIGQQFIALWVDYDDETETWFYLPVSTARLNIIRFGEIDLRVAFRESEVSYVWKATVHLRTGEWTVIGCPSAPLLDEFLPDEGQRIRVPEDSPHAPRSSSLSDLAIGSRRDALAVALYFARKYKYQAPVRELGQFMEALQEQLDVLGQHRRGKFGPGGSVSADILQHTQVVFDSTFPSSFGMKLVASLPPDLAGESLAAIALQDLMIIISMDDRQLPGFLKETHNRVAVKYRKFIESLLDNEAGLSLVWQRPNNKNVVRASLTYERAVEVYGIVSAVQDEAVDTIMLRGILNAVNLRTHHYEISTPDGKKRFAGKILPSALGQASSATMSLLYDAVIHMTVEVTTASGAQKYSYYLVDLKKVE
jgi:hypothetical protein